MTDIPTLCDADGERSLRFGDGMAQSRMLRRDPARLLVEYTRLMMGFLLFQPAPARIAMIGLGGGSLARYCRRRLPDADFTAIEISAAVVAVRDEFDLPPDGPSFRVVHGDGAAFVRRAGAPLDVLLVDGFDGSGQPESLCSPAFYADCRARLAPGGVLVVNLLTDPATGARARRIRAAFAGRTVVVRADGSENAVVFAGTDAAWPPAFPDLVARRRMLEASHPVDLGATLAKIVASPRAGTAPRRRRRTGRAHAAPATGPAPSGRG